MLKPELIAIANKLNKKRPKSISNRNKTMKAWEDWRDEVITASREIDNGIDRVQFWSLCGSFLVRTFEK